MGNKKRGEEIPKVLKQRYSIDSNERIFLKTIEEMSPRDTGTIYVMGNPLNLPVPTVPMLSEKLKKSENEILEMAESVASKWNLPKKESLPTGNGIYDTDHALIHTLGNQHKLRWDENMQNYRVPRIHMFNAELCSGTLIANNDAFLGEKIIRQSLDLNEMLNSYHVQSGIMPEIIEIYGKAKHNRAILTGTNKTGKPLDFEKLERARKTLELEGHKLAEKDWKNIEYIANTIDSREEAAESVACEIAPMYKDIPEHVPIHWYFGPSDFENIKYIKDKLVAKRKIINKRIAEANKKLPDLRDQLIETRQRTMKTLVEKILSDKVYLHVNAQRNKYEDDEFPEKGKIFRNIIESYFTTQSGIPAKRVEQLKKSIKKNYAQLIEGSEEMLNSYFETAIINYRDLSTFKQIKDFKDKQTNNLEKESLKISSIKSKIDELIALEDASLVEETQGPAWFTGYIAMLPTDAKIMQMLAKKEYQKLYIDNLIPTLKKRTGKNHQIYLHTDNLISVHVPDPEYTLKWNSMTDEERANVPIGTLMTSYPQTNIQRSNEPLKGGFAELQGFQQRLLSSRIANGNERPKTHGEFSKRDHSFPNFLFTSHAAEGFLTQTKFTVAPTRVKGVNGTDKELTTFFKLPTRQNYHVLYDLAARGNIGSWYMKRAEKGGDTAGNVIVIDHPDRSQEVIFFNDLFYEKIGKEYGPIVEKLELQISSLEEKVSRRGTQKYKKENQTKLTKAKKELQEIFNEIKPKFYNVFNANDLHFGEWSMPGRFTLEEGIRASQQAALQAEGVDSMKASFISEAFNGAQNFRSYDAAKLGTWVSGMNFNLELNALTKGMMKAGYPLSEIVEYQRVFTQQMLDGIVTPKLEGQTSDFITYEVPMFQELMNKGAKIYIGMGNHHQASGDNMQSEGDIVKKLIDSDGFYENQGNLEIGYGSTSGQSFNYDMFHLPGIEGKVIPWVFAHKAWSGKTEINGPVEQMVRTKDAATYMDAADRHHEGMIAQNGKMIFLDSGKPPVNPFVQMIGKASSVRGTQIPKYDPTGRNGYMAKRAFYDPVVEKIIGWDEKASILDRSYSIITETMKNDSFAKKLAQINELQKYMKK